MPAPFPHPDAPASRVALRIGETVLTYGELREAITRDRARLADSGVQAGDRVAVVMTRERASDIVAAIVALLAQLDMGVVSVPLNPKLGPRELRHILTDAAPRLVRGPADLTLPPELGLTTSAFGADPSPHASARSRAEGAADEAFLLYTSGTTGAPKGAQITAANITANLERARPRVGLGGERHRGARAPPLPRPRPFLGRLWEPPGGRRDHVPASLRRGGRRRTPSAPRRSLCSFGVPTMYARLLDRVEAGDAPLRDALAGARLLVSGSAGLPAREHRRAQTLLGRGVHERYGLTETLINCAVPASAEPDPGYVGPPLPGVELKRVDDARRTLPPEADDDVTLGEIAVRSAQVFGGYLNRPDANAAAMDEEGWFYTGDIATRRRDGSIRIVGRRSTDLIKTGGYRVGAGEIEACLREDARVAEVAVVGRPDEDPGQRIEAFVVLRDGAPPRGLADELIAMVAHELTPHKRPRAIHWVAELPRNAMGKVQKKRLLATPPPPEVRHDAFSDSATVISLARRGMHRPPAVSEKKTRADALPALDGPCPFCPGNEAQAEPSVAEWREGDSWRARIVPNLYPWIADVPGEVTAGATPAMGAHDVVIEHPGHDVDLVDFDAAHVAGLLGLLAARVGELEERPGVAQVNLFRNRGRRAGSSQPHPHAQLVGAPILGPKQHARERAARSFYEREGRRVLEAEVDRAREDGRVVAEENDVIAFCPFAPRHNYELLVAPVSQEPFHAMTMATREALAANLPSLVEATLRARGASIYNLVVHLPPVATRDAEHTSWLIEVAPRAGFGAGFELASGLAMVVTPPELAAKEIREHLRRLRRE